MYFHHLMLRKVTYISSTGISLAATIQQQRLIEPFIFVKFNLIVSMIKCCMLI